MTITYKTSGVSITKSESFIDKIKPIVKNTFSKNVKTDIGLFGSFYEIDTKKFKQPVLISSIDGVGTKVLIADYLKIYDTIGEDLVNHCVNDIAVCGATPLFFLDYYATGKLDIEKSTQILKGLAKGCKNNNLSLVGGETAEMPGLYKNKEFDLAGAIVGIASKKDLSIQYKIQKGDLLIGLESNGLHTNGYSLVRRIFKKSDYRNIHLDSGIDLGNELLKVHKSYLKFITEARNTFNVKAFSHITGGGIIGNTKRIIPKNRKIIIDWKSWDRPEIFNLIQKKGKVPEIDMRKTFNLGIGLITIVPKNIFDRFLKFFNTKNYNLHFIGEIK